VPDNVVDLWKDYDPAKEDLEVKVIKEWKEDGVTTRYITFKVGTFKGKDARIAAYYSFPDNGQKNPAFVWTHGGGQRADRKRGIEYAKKGFAVVDLNWLGRPLEEDIAENTDWGEMDPTQGPNFYAKAKRKGWKRGVTPDEYTIDPVPSPRNNNWFLLVVAGKRGITFLEQQPEVNAERIGFAGFSMGGTITSMVAMDPRLKAVAPFVGGTGFLHEDFPGVPGTSISVHYRDHLEMYKNTVDPAAYWPQVKCPVMFISASNDFHAGFERIYKSMGLLPHSAWRVSSNIHINHGPGPEQWIMMEKWFNLHLKRIDQRLPLTPKTSLLLNEGEAVFTIKPEEKTKDLLQEIEVYYSYDPNSITRFWNCAETQRAPSKDESVVIPAYTGLPLYVHAMCRYKDAAGETFVVNSVVEIHLPEQLDLSQFSAVEKTKVFDDFSKGFQDWSQRNPHSISTYKFQNPALDLSDTKKLSFSLDPKGKAHYLILSTQSKFLGHGKGQGGFRLVKRFEGEGVQELIIAREEFKGDKEGEILEWDKISTFQVSIQEVEPKRNVELHAAGEQQILKLIKMVD